MKLFNRTPPKRLTYRDALPLRHRPPLPPYHELRATPRSGTIELLPVEGTYVHK